MTEPFELTTPTGLIHVTVQPWSENQRPQAISELRQVVDSLTAAFLTATGTVCARTSKPLQAGDLQEIERFREFLTRAPQAGPADAYQQVYSEPATDTVLEERVPADLNPWRGAAITALHSHTAEQPCDDQCSVYPSHARAESLHTLTIYGASDDLVEVEGHVRAEYNAHRRAVILLVTAPSGARLWVTAEFEPTPLQDVGDGWAIGVLHADPEWTHPLRFTRRPDRDTDPAIELDVPAGTTVTEWGEQ